MQYMVLTMVCAKYKSLMKLMNLAFVLGIDNIVVYIMLLAAHKFDRWAVNPGSTVKKLPYALSFNHTREPVICMTWNSI